jgi:hypothetical protein
MASAIIAPATGPAAAAIDPLEDVSMGSSAIAVRSLRPAATLVAVALALIVAAFAAPRASALSPIYEFGVEPSTTKAGGHPDIRTLVWVGNRFTQHIPAPSCDCQDPKDVSIEMPTGVIGDPHAAPKCSAADFANLVCGPDTQIGSAVISLNAEKPGTSGFGVMGVYNLEPHPGQAGLLAFNVPLVKVPIYIAINSRTEGDYGLEATVTNITHLLPLAFVDMHLWGVPASPAHNVDRLPAGWEPFFDGDNPPTPSNAPELAFLDNPTTCDDQSLTASVRVVAYDRGVTEASSAYPATTGCDQLSFNPSLYAQPTSTQTDTASGLDVDLKVPQSTSPSVPSPSEIRATTVTLPPGFSINPNAADGKTACTDAESSIGTREAARCPETSKVGTVTVDSSALPLPIPGYIYLGAPKPGDPYRLILTADGFNVHVKLAGSAHADPQTGQITVSFPDLPQTPFSDFNLHFFGSERGLLATPTQCGTYAVTSTFVPWDSALAEQTSAQFFTLSGGPGGSSCPTSSRPFAPAFHAGVADKTAGQHAPFSLTLTRPDGDQNLSSLNVTTPPGFAATLAGVPYCSDAALAAAAAQGASGVAESSAPSCPAASQIGVASAGAGAGTHPVYLPGRVYLAGPYRGAPLSLAVVTPAVSGPYDLGNVVVRAAVFVDPTSAQITAVSDPLPQIVEGIPLRLRYILVNLNRPGFTLNPTNCDQFGVRADVFGSQGAMASLETPFQIANCRNLGFGPKLSLNLTGGVNRKGHPAIHAHLRADPGDANISRVAVTLPSTSLLDQANISAPCTRPQLAANACPESTRLGSAVAETPVLANPLQGPVYLVTSTHRLPDLLVQLHGQVDITLRGRIDQSHHGLRTTFENLPDVHVSDFRLNLAGGAKKGLIINSVSLCGSKTRALVHMVGQNNGRTNGRVPLAANCAKGSRHAKRHARHRRAAKRGAQR